MELRNEHNLTSTDVNTLRLASDEYVPIYLHTDMFIPTLEGQASDEQQAKWLGLAKQLRILGWQTELGHGSNLSGLETTATLDKATDEWVIHSPHLSSAKFWIGALGKTATHAIVVAKLIIDGRDYGAHPLFVPIRSLDNHKTFPGLTIHDIGPKTYVRVELVENSAVTLSRACTIATRYLAVRRQGPVKAPGQLEPQTLDHLMVQYRVFPRVAQTYALRFTGMWMLEMYEKLMAQLANNDVGMLADVHAYSSGLKSYTTTVAIEGVEDLRKCMGGHGYSMFSGIPDYYNTSLPSNTYEGENYLLTQQSAKYLLKQVEFVHQGQLDALSSTTSFLRQLVEPSLFLQQRWSVQSAQDLTNHELILCAYAHRAARVVSELARAKHSGIAWEDLQVESLRASRAYCQYLVAHCIAAYLESDKFAALSNATQTAIIRLMNLYHLYTIEQDMGDFVEDGFVSLNQANLIRNEVRVLLRAIRPDAVGLAESYGWPDFLLNSALGSSDGRAYERMVECLKREPLNNSEMKDGVIRGYHDYIRPLIKGEIGSWTESNVNRAKL
ncbi:acyl-CoA dehydrogenase/oxidase C-terminal [Syncephalis fuscata]|nr:acyl-CoA dehydrogenase/oxidase C-terminal [Syncephalis fuscata]